MVYCLNCKCIDCKAPQTLLKTGWHHVVGVKVQVSLHK